MNLGTLIPRHARFLRDNLAVVFEDQRYTYGDFNRRVNRLANALLGLGIGKGDKVATVLPNCMELLDLYWALARIGAVVVPLSPLLQPKLMASLAKDSDTVMMIAYEDYAEAMKELRGGLSSIPPERYILVGAQGHPEFRSYRDLVAAASDADPPYVELHDDDLYDIVYSSGTTGDPKGIVHTHYVRANYCAHLAASWRMTPDSVCLHTGSIIFNGAFVTLMPLFHVGGTYVLARQFDADLVIDLIEREKVTHTMMVPAQIIAVMNSPRFSPEKLASLEVLLSLGAPLHLEHKHRLEELLPGRFHELYGLTEGFITILDRRDVARKPGSVGCAPPFFEMRIVGEDGSDLPPGEVGEIVGRGPILMPGYYKRPDLTDQAIKDGWLFTGDLGYADEDGFLYLVDRMKDLIISGGVNVYPRDIEEVVVQHPAVKEVAVFGVPDEKWGETPVAAVIPSDPQAVTEDELRDWINAHVGARFQQVSRVLLLDDFPRSAAGKTLKRELRDTYRAS